MKKFLGGGIVFLFCACLLQPSLATATIWTIPQVNGGSLILDDWGIVGPGGRTAMDFDPIGGGFDWDNLGYQQDIYTVDPDYKTPDATKTVWNESYTREFTNANMDAQTNFYHWAYTSPANSHFFMSIEKDGDYLVKKNDMEFAFYNTFKYEEGAPEPGARTRTLPGPRPIVSSPMRSRTARDGADRFSMTTPLPLRPWPDRSPSISPLMPIRARHFSGLRSIQGSR